MVEQPGFVRAGREEFTTDELSFHASLDEVSGDPSPVTFLLSSVLQYLERPDEMLDALVHPASRHLILDRTPVSSVATDVLCIQHAPPSVYEASYPAWVFSRTVLLERLDPAWFLVADEIGADGSHVTDAGLAFEYRSMIFERRE